MYCNLIKIKHLLLKNYIIFDIIMIKYFDPEHEDSYYEDNVHMFI